MARLGDALRLQREAMGVTLPQAAEDTRIREKFLLAIESGDYQSLPGTVYTKGFLRNYAGYLDLDAEEMLALYTGERGGSEPARSFAPMKPLVKRSFIFTPTVLVPVVVLAGIILFIGYVYYQFTNFAVAPHVDITDPPGDAVSQAAEYVVKGRTNPDGRITVRVSPGQDTLNDIHPAQPHRDPGPRSRGQARPGIADHPAQCPGIERSAGSAADRRAAGEWRDLYERSGDRLGTGRPVRLERHRQRRGRDRRHRSAVRGHGQLRRRTTDGPGRGEDRDGRRGPGDPDRHGDLHGRCGHRADHRR